MPPDAGFHSVRSVAANVLHGVTQGGSLTRLLAESAGSVNDKDRALLSELLFGSCRWYHRLDAVLSLLMQKPLRKRDGDVHALLIIGLYQLNHMRIKPHAVLAETVNAARHLGKPMFTRLVNGVLRRFQREQESLLKQADNNPAVASSMPQWLLEELKSAWPDQWQQITSAMLQQPPLTLRLNTRLVGMQDYLQQLLDQHMPAKPVKGMESALVLDKAVPVEQIPGFMQGLVSVQDAGAQLAAVLLDATQGSMVLDACSAPGGKTGHILERSDNLQLTAIDIDEQRLEKVQENLQRLGLHAVLEVGDAAKNKGDWVKRQYDFILLDVPCSATGVIRRHPDIKLLRKRSDIAGLVEQQRKILLNVWPLLKPGGGLLYATCSLLAAENEQQVDWLLKQKQDAVELSLEPLVEHHRRKHGIQLLPGDLNMDGFFYSLLTKGKNV